MVFIRLRLRNRENERIQTQKAKRMEDVAELQRLKNMKKGDGEN